MIIEEFCCYGNTRDYLLKHRYEIVNKIGEQSKEKDIKMYDESNHCECKR